MAPLLLAVFDLDYTVWEPEMYQISGPPKLVEEDEVELRGSNKEKNKQKRQLHRSMSIEDGKIVTDQDGTPITIFDGASHALSEINRMKKNDDANIRAAVASRTDEPKWAHQCMKWLTIDDGSTLASSFDHIEISFADKCHHFENLRQKTGIPFDSMAFFDNEHWNIKSVSKLGVKCIYTPDGMTRRAWQDALAMFD
mmetsp:Transcript_2008/g.2517  ORF Transcript_2008/g.2517 Transcript_2008/m.2517 type:complete len:197 (+) Transcript_2008:106-696(+)|eukprot:CAMPEP_0172483710 /NCGR_PEP_ID=MMETSP1066-20121228/10826_1 /TAXON_ID=671091 /ORGANISM="Coscinodiscus wailesii, Strain CCMP2513" /LENGTH=196 /DNA_ID=CAMNT_0013247767 /DNA_START=106 /DNA_END=696 /DNA_ORIENTATION=-